MHKEIKVHRCSLCKHVSMSEKTLKHHIVGVHETSNTCQICARTFTSKNILKNHIAYEHEGKTKIKVNCSLCDATFHAR